MMSSGKRGDRVRRNSKGRVKVLDMSESQRHVLVFRIRDYRGTTLSSILYCLRSKLFVVIIVRS